MNRKVTIGAVVVAAVGLGFLIKKLYDDGYLDDAEYRLRKLASQSKRNIKDLVSTGENQLEYVGERADQVIQRGKRAVEDVLE